MTDYNLSWAEARDIIKAKGLPWTIATQKRLIASRVNIHPMSLRMNKGALERWLAKQ